MALSPAEASLSPAGASTEERDSDGEEAAKEETEWIKGEEPGRWREKIPVGIHFHTQFRVHPLKVSLKVIVNVVVQFCPCLSSVLGYGYRNAW